MDGASKFVRGDAIASILILFINVLGGLAIGTMEHGLSFGEAGRIYTLLTIGDGLVAQIPSLLLSTAVAVIVTRVSQAQDMSSQIVSQVFHQPRTMAVTAAVLVTLGLIPGMPNFSFLTLAGICGYASYRLTRKPPPEPEILEAAPKPEPQTRELTWDDVMPLETIGLEVGYRLIPLVDRQRGGQLVNRIKGVRRKLTDSLGFLLPPVHIRDNLDLKPSQYRVSLMGVPLGEGEIEIDKELAINPGQVFGELKGIKTEDPAFGLPAIWIENNQQEEAQMLGYTVVDGSTVVATHISQVLQAHAHELIGHEELQQMLERLGKSAPKLVEALTPKILPAATVLKVLQNLLKEGIPVRNMRKIAETLADQGARSQEPDVLTSAVRVALGRSIVQDICGSSSEIEVMTLDPELEQILNNANQGGAVGGVEPGLVERIHESLTKHAQDREAIGGSAILLVAPGIRPWLARMLRGVRSLHVLAYNEIPEDRQIRMTATVG
ncbi:MAG: FHIPEP family type III secretion protein, partial [Pseudomonadota bacterium]